MKTDTPVSYTYTVKYGPCNRTPSGVCTFCMVVKKHYKSGDPLSKHKNVKFKNPRSVLSCQIGTNCNQSVDCMTEQCKHTMPYVEKLLYLNHPRCFSFPGNIMIQE